MQNQIDDQADDIIDYEIPEEEDDISYDQDQFYDEVGIDEDGNPDDGFIIQDDDGSIQILDESMSMQR